MTTRSLKTCAAALGAAALLLGCGSQVSGGTAAGQAPTSPGPTQPDLTQATHKPVGAVIPSPRRTPPVASGQSLPSVVWKGDMLLVTTFGSSLCQPVAESAAVVDLHTLVLRFGDPPDRRGIPCTDHFVPSLSRIPAPSGDVDLNADVYATFDVEGAPRKPILVELVHPLPG